jgi:hypothetical protein
MRARRCRTGQLGMSEAMVIEYDCFVIPVIADIAESITGYRWLRIAARAHRCHLALAVTCFFRYFVMRDVVHALEMNDTEF